MNVLHFVLPAALLMAAPALAQQAGPGHDEHHPAAATATAPALAASTDADMHERCKAVMGHKMDPKHPHEHSMDKQGITAHARGVPPTKAEMDKMHEQCAEMMAKAEAQPKK